jgi:uncharacterized protein
MASSYKTPGVYREEVFLKPETTLRTGVAGFVGFADESNQGGPPLNTPVVLHRKDEFASTFNSRPESYLGDAISGFFDNGGVRCYVVRADSNPSADRAIALQRGIEALAPLSDVDLVAVPDAITLHLQSGGLDVGAIERVQRKMLTHCAALGDRMAVLDPLPGATTDQVLKHRENLMIGQAEPVNGALYYPWLRTADDRLVPPGGHVAGIFARTDAKVGFFKAPANEEVFGIVGLEVSVDNNLQDLLNPEGVNCLRVFPGRGIRVWGARTLSRDPTWRYINVRRLFLTLRRWIDINMAWATFEPNGFRLWVRIQRELTTYLDQLFQDGALKGTTPAEAFFVKCDAETNPPEVRELGQVVTEIGISPLAPAEFIVVRIIHRTSDQAS